MMKQSRTMLFLHYAFVVILALSSLPKQVKSFVTTSTATASFTNTNYIQRQHQNSVKMVGTVFEVVATEIVTAVDAVSSVDTLLVDVADAATTATTTTTATTAMDVAASSSSSAASSPILSNMMLVNAATTSIIPSQGPLAVIKTVFDPVFETAVFKDMSRAADAATFFISCKKNLRLISIFGRLFVMAADYIPDHYIEPSQLGIHVILLGTTMSDIMKEFFDTSTATTTTASSNGVADNTNNVNCDVPTDVLWADSTANINLPSIITSNYHPTTHTNTHTNKQFSPWETKRPIDPHTLYGSPAHIHILFSMIASDRIE